MHTSLFHTGILSSWNLCMLSKPLWVLMCNFLLVPEKNHQWCVNYFQVVCQWSLIDPQTLHISAIVRGYPHELERRTSLLKMPHNVSYRAWRHQTSTSLEVASILLIFHSDQRCCAYCQKRKVIMNLNPMSNNTGKPGKTCPIMAQMSWD